MAIDKSKMVAWMGKTGAKMPGGTATKEAPQQDAAEGAEGEMEEGGPERFYPMMERLEEAAPDIEAAVESSGLAQSIMDEAAELSPEEEAQLKELCGELDEELREGLVNAGEMTWEEAMHLGKHLAGEGYAEDADVMGAALFQVSKCCRAMAAEQGAEEGEEEETEPAEESAEELE